MPQGIPDVLLVRRDNDRTREQSGSIDELASEMHVDTG